MIGALRVKKVPMAESGRKGNGDFLAQHVKGGVHLSEFENGWMDDLRLYVLFNSISVISGWRKVDNERLCAMELRLRLRRFCTRAEFEKDVIFVYRSAEYFTVAGSATPPTCPPPPPTHTLQSIIRYSFLLIYHMIIRNGI